MYCVLCLQLVITEIFIKVTIVTARGTALAIYLLHDRVRNLLHLLLLLLELFSFRLRVLLKPVKCLVHNSDQFILLTLINLSATPFSSSSKVFLRLYKYDSKTFLAVILPWIFLSSSANSSASCTIRSISSGAH